MSFLFFLRILDVTELELLRDDFAEDLLYVRGILQVFGVEIGLHIVEDHAFHFSWTLHVVEINHCSCRHPFNAQGSIAEERCENALDFITHLFNITVKDARGFSVEPSKPFNIDNGGICDNPCIEVLVKEVSYPPDDGEGPPASREEHDRAIWEQSEGDDCQEKRCTGPEDSEENDDPMLVDDSLEFLVRFQMPEKKQSIEHSS